MKHRVRLSVLIAFLAMLFVSYKDVSALTYSSSAGLEFTFLPTITVTFSPNTGFIINDLSAGNAAYSNTVTVTVDSNSSDGYVLSATVGKTNDNNRNNNRLVHTNNTNYFEGIATNASLTLNNLGSNKWGYATYDTTNEEWSDYSGLATVGNTGTTLMTTDTSGTESIDMKIGASAASNQVAGAFTNDINFTATANIVTYDYTITFVANNPGTVTNMPSSISSASYNTGGIVQISSTVPTVTDYAFLGWCDSTVSGTTCAGNLYQPGDYLKLDSASSSTTNNITLNAVWQFNGIYMQDITDAQCKVNVGTNGNATGIGDEITVYDKRDEKDYTVKLINGQCWMTQNLKYLGDTGSAAKTMTIGNNNSNVANKSITLYSLDSSDAGSFNAYSSHCDDTNGYNYACVYDSGNTSTGVWYNYYAASAGTISTNSNSTAATSDICPAGWHLPSGPNTTANTDYNKLVGNTTSGYQIPAAGLTAFSAVAGGDYRNGSLNYTGYGFWWSATANFTTSRRSLVYDSSDGQFSGDYYDSRYFGIFVRCVKGEDKKYMQDQTANSLATLMPNVGDTAILTDKRDNQDYTVAKLADEKYWMTSNLNLAGGTTISCDTSDCDNYTIPTDQGWQSGGKLPASSSDFSSNNYAYVYNSGSTTCGDNSPCYSYYSWDAATLGSGRSISTDNQNAPYSICPKGWRLPTTYNGSGTAAEATDFRALMIAFGGSNSIQTYNSSTSLTGATMSTTLQSTPNNFLLAGCYDNGSFDVGGSAGYYWSATSSSSSARARYLSFNSTNFGSADNYYRSYGFSVRCVKD